METATAFSRRSTCSRAQVGAVFSRDGRILSTGYNGAPSGMTHCNHSYQITIPGILVDTQACVRSVHAEANGIAWAARYGVSLDGCEVHTTLSPCLDCAMLIINAGVVRVVYRDQYRIKDGLTLMRNADILVQNVVDFI